MVLRIIFSRAVAIRFYRVLFDVLAPYATYTMSNNSMLYGDSIYIGFFCRMLHIRRAVWPRHVEVSCKIDSRPFAKQVYHCQRERKINT